MSKVFKDELFQEQPFACRLIGEAVSKRRLAHALLLTGGALDNKWELARQLAMSLNCTNADREDGPNACFTQPGEVKACQNCRWIQDDKHPMAFLSLSGEDKKSGKIAVEKARSLSQELATSSQYARVVVIEDASQDVFHRPAANALLKTIEDPGPGTVFVLFARRQDDVLATVVSRCQVVPIKARDMEPSPLSGGNGEAQLEALLPGITDEEQAELRDLREFLSVRHGSKATSSSRLMIGALDLSKRMQSLLSDDLPLPRLIDMVVSIEAARLRQEVVGNNAAALYLRDLLSLAENAKIQVDHYVSPKAAVESFALSWWRLGR